MTDKWPYNLPIWRRSHQATSPDGQETASMPSATEVSMGNPTMGELLLESGLRLPWCSPAFIWSDCSRYLVVPQYFVRFGMLRRQRLAILDVRQRTAQQSRDVAYYFQPKTFKQGVLTVRKEPFRKKAVIVEYQAPFDAGDFEPLVLDWLAVGRAV